MSSRLGTSLHRLSAALAARDRASLQSNRRETKRPRFKPGDRVRFTLPFDFFGAHRQGDLGTVTKTRFGIYTDPSHKLLAVDWDDGGLDGVYLNSVEKVG